MSETTEVFVGSWRQQGHLIPFLELGRRLLRGGCIANLVTPAHLSSAIPPSFTFNPPVAVDVAQIASSSSPPTPLSHPFNEPFGGDLAAYLEKRRTAGGGEPPGELYAFVGGDVDWIRDVFRKFNVPVNRFPTEFLAKIMGQFAWEAQASDVWPGEARLLTGLPKDLAIGFSDIEKELSEFLQFGLPGEARLLAGPPGPGPRPGGGRGGPPKLGHRPPWVLEAEGSIRRLTNEIEMLQGRPLLPDSREILSYPSTGGFPSHRGWNSTSPPRSPFGTWSFPRKRYYNTDSRVEHLKVGQAASKDTPKNVMDDESKGISETVASEAFASFQFDLKFQCRIGRLQIGASISRLARNMR